MASNKKPRKAYRPRPVTAHTMTLAKHRACKPAIADREEIINLLSTTMKALREGVATQQQWSIVAGSVALALAIERQGVVRGLTEHFQAAEESLQHIYDRALHKGGGRWVPVTLYFREIDALTDFVNLHAYQVYQLGRAQWLAAIDAAQRDADTFWQTITTTQNAERLAA